MDRAAFADELCAKLFHRFGSGNQDSPKSIRVLGVVRAVGEILVERNGAGNFLRLEIDLRRDSERSQTLRDAAVETGNRLRYEGPGGPGALAGVNFDGMLLEIELDFEYARRVRHRSRGQAARVDIQRDVPPLIQGGR